MEQHRLDLKVMSWVCKSPPMDILISSLLSELGFIKIAVLSPKIGICSNFSTGLMIFTATIPNILHLAVFFHPFPPCVEPAPVVPHGQIWQVQRVDNKLCNIFFQLCHLAYRRTLA